MRNDVLVGYNVHTEADRSLMLKEMGLNSVEDLLGAIDPAIRLQRPLNLPTPLPEWTLRRKLESLAQQNATTATHSSYLGGGAYQHYIPETVRAIASRGEFLTAYTPYQPEMSQGILRVLYDFQQLIRRILGQPAVNCSVYDGSTAVAEASWMACLISKRNRLLVSASLWPQSLQVLKTYLRGRKVELVPVPAEPDTGQMDVEAARQLLGEEPSAGIVVQSPNRFGVLEKIAAISQLSRSVAAQTVASVNPLIVGCLSPPGQDGADIVCCEAQPLGLELNAGGPYLGVIATRTEHEEFLPGRIVGICQDLRGEPAFALVKEEREQHVARHEATSHICSNQAILALRVSVYLSTLGELGFRRVAELNMAKAHYLEAQLAKLPGVRRVKSGSFFNEFLLELPCDVSKLLARLLEKRIFGGIDCSEWESQNSQRLLVAVTELKTKTELDEYADHFAQALRALN